MAENKYSPNPSPGGPSGNIFTEQKKIFFVLLMSFSAVGLVLFCWYVCILSHQSWRRHHHHHHRARAVSTSTTTNSFCDGRLDPKLLSSLPIFVYSFVAEEAKLECSVCLTEFKEGEEGRLLPKCRHSFHTECVDVWFGSHSTCPLCRSLAEPESSSLLAV